MNLNRVTADAFRHFGGEHLCHGGFLVVVASLFFEPGGFVEHVACDFDLGRGVCQHPLDGLLFRDGFAERFAREARALARLDHPRIVRIYDFGQAGGFCYLAMEFVEGTNLGDLLAGPLWPRETATRLLALADQLDDADAVQIRLKDLELHRPRQWGACWLSSVLYQKLQLDVFWLERLRPSRKGTRWEHVLQTLVSYRLIDPGSEWRLHREWFERSAMGDLLGEDMSVAQPDTLYRCLDKLLPHKPAVEQHLRERLGELFAIDYDLLLYDVTSTYFEGRRCPLARLGHSRDGKKGKLDVVVGDADQTNLVVKLESRA